MYKAVIDDMKVHMDKSIEALRREYAKIRTGRASTGLLEEIKVDYYGTPSAISQVATLAVPEPRTITIQPWEAKMIAPIEKAIMNANIGMTPANDGKTIRLNLPPLTEERRKEIVKQVKHKGEEHKIAIRNERRDAKELIEVAQKDGDISEDEAKKCLEKMQKETDDGVKKIDEIVAAKEKDVMQV